MRIIPAIDIIDGKCVRLTKGEYNTKIVYNEDPLEVAKSFEDQGVEFLHLVDLDGAKANRITNQKVLETIANNTSLSIDFGGGLKSDQDVKIAFESGASQITGGSIAAKNQEVFVRWIEDYGAERVILGADCRDRKIATNGWLEESQLDVIEFIDTYEKRGIRKVISTDISKDGTLQGPSTPLYQEIMERTNVELIASGGISDLSDLLLLKEMGCEGAIVGKAIYEGRLSLQQISELC
ncbi:MAG: 1-(5-phosphoribosyl)-5-[(5-phosphoribosylamino)methylideneamino]imidazole-4-carboxamide isomerase [Flavobacteriales bacterium]|nr:1-(5-phosphoribosyl)-5-[(5-phosphoribosylamino)methylideneamino]imidazole-4-carboxamide isomerase [Flavobacteriales bacterium]